MAVPQAGMRSRHSVENAWDGRCVQRRRKPDPDHTLTTSNPLVR